MKIKRERRTKQLAFRTTETIAHYLQAEADINEVTISTMIEFMVKKYMSEKCPDLMKAIDDGEDF